MSLPPKNEFKTFLKSLQDGIWYPNEFTFRHRMNLEAKHALVHSLKNKDITLFTRLIEAIPNAADKIKIKKYAIEKLPFQIKQSSGLFAIDTDRWLFFSLGIISNFNLMDPFIASRATKGAIRFDAGDIAPEEFISIVADVLVLNRRTFDKEQIDHLIDVLQNISTRKNTTYA